MFVFLLKTFLILDDVYIVNQGGNDQSRCNHCYQIVHFFLLSLRGTEGQGEMPYTAAQLLQHTGMGNGSPISIQGPEMVHAAKSLPR